MKKIFIVAIAAMLCCVMLVPVSATNTVNYNGHELPNIYSLGIIDDIFAHAFIRNDGDGQYTLVITRHEPLVNSTKGSVKVIDYYSYKIQNGEWYLYDYVDDYGVFSMKHENFVWSRFDLIDDNGDVYYPGTKTECDGSSCPATDVNTDNICDDCGLVFAVLRDYPIPDPYLVFTPEYQTRFPYAFIYKGENNTNHMIFSSTEPVYFNGAVVVENNDDDLSYLKYSVNGDTWKYDGGFSEGNDIVTDTVYPSFNMNDLDGNLAFKQNTDFFPIPLWVEMDNLTQGEMVKLSPTVVAIMATLTIVGIGCLASLVLLKIFGKRSLLYRK